MDDSSRVSIDDPESVKRFLEHLDQKTGRGAYAATVATAARLIRELEEALQNLLAIVHRDGGHHTEKVGLNQSVEDAMRLIPNERAVDVIAYLDDWLDKLVRYPQGWGDPFSVENQYMSGVKHRWYIESGGHHLQPTRAWTRIIHDAGYLSNIPLAFQVKDDEEKLWEELVRLLPLMSAYGPGKCSKCDGLGFNADEECMSCRGSSGWAVVKRET